MPSIGSAVDIYGKIVLRRYQSRTKDHFVQWNGFAQSMNLVAFAMRNGFFIFRANAMRSWI
jgi:hypothetical protein